MDFSYDTVIEKTCRILNKAGLPFDMAQPTAHILVEGELLGHRTHGLQLLPAYVKAIETGDMEKTGCYEKLNKSTASVLLDGRYLPGPWLVEEGIKMATEMALSHGTGTVVIRRSHHIGCLAAFLEKTARQNLILLLACSDPANRTVAPFGGLDPVYSPNPLAMGIPTSGDPLLIDVSMSATANGVVAMAAGRGEKLPGKWLQTRTGLATDDPSTFLEDPPSTVLPLGGQDLGYKGFALGMMVEVLTNALAGQGRAESPTRWGANVFVQVIDPAAMSDSAMVQETDYFKSVCLQSTALDTERPVRMPGEKGLELKAKQLQNGLMLLPQTKESFLSLVRKYCNEDL